MNARKPAAVVTAADAPEIVSALPCGCRLPFDRCEVADDLLNAELNASDDLLRIGGLPDTTADAYAAARARWQAACRAYDQHIGRVTG